MRREKTRVSFSVFYVIYIEKEYFLCEFSKQRSISEKENIYPSPLILQQRFIFIQNRC